MYQTIERHLRVLGLRALLRATAAKATGSTAFCRLRRSDCRHPFRVRLLTSDVETFEQIFLRHEYACEVDREPEVIVDAGANIGLASIYFANRYTRATVLSIEPEQQNFDLLRENVGPYRNVIPLHAALWAENTEISVLDPGRGNWAFRTSARSTALTQAVKPLHSVAGLTVDKLMSHYHLSKIDILKMDIEGAEKEVLANCTEWIDSVDALIVELHDRIQSGCSDAFYSAIQAFENTWRRRENHYASRENRSNRPTIGMRPIDS